MDTVQLLQHALDRAGAAAAGHGDVELVGVFGHGVSLRFCLYLYSRSLIVRPSITDGQAVLSWGVVGKSTGFRIGNRVCASRGGSRQYLVRATGASRIYTLSAPTIISCVDIRTHELVVSWCETLCCVSPEQVCYFRRFSLMRKVRGSDEEVRVPSRTRV